MSAALAPPAGSVGDFWRRYRRNRGALLGLAILGLVVALAAAAPILYPESAFEMVGRPFEPPFGAFPLGTDMLGRDVAAGIAHGARVSLLVAVSATAAAVCLGTLVGATAGYAGGWLDNLLMRGTEFFQTTPSFILALVLVAVLTPSLATTIVALAAVSWPPVARLVRGQFLSLREAEFVQACIALGMSDARIVLTQILPNCLSPVVVTASLMVASAILFESGLSFLGLGDPNVMSWGFMIGAGRTVLRTAWWLSALPGVMILLTVVAINLVGEGLNDAVNPRLRGR